MSHDNFLEKLLNGVAVEWKPLGELGALVRGNGLQKKDFVGTGFPAIHYGQIHTQYGLSANKTFTHISESLASRLKKAQKNDLLLATTSENDEDVVKPLAWLGEQTAISGDMMLFRHDQNVKYLAYFFHTQEFQEQKRKYITGAKVRRVSSGDLAKIVVPIPCPEDPKKSLEIQAEIVRILDAFAAQTTALTTELTEELTARKKQYAYYRDQLLSFEEGDVEWKTLGELGVLERGSGFQKKDSVEAGFPAIHYGQIHTKYRLSADTTYMFVSNAHANKLRKAKKNDLLLATTSENDKDVAKPLAWLGGEVAISGDMMLFRHKQNVKYLAYFLQTPSFQENKIKYITGAKVRRISRDSLSKIVVPIPFANDPKKSLAEQARIVAILDKFDALTNSISEVLPREIELRQKQYEYYRDMLFSFPKPQEVA